MSLQQLNWLYQICNGIYQLVVIVFMLLALSLARKHGKHDFLKWLFPLVLGELLKFVVWFFSTFRSFIWTKEPAGLDFVFAFANFIPMLLFVYTAIMIWHTLREGSVAGKAKNIWAPHPKEPE